MTAIFVDTNILVYAATPLSGPDATKSELARRLIREEDIVLSTQVLQEFYGVVVQNPFVDPQFES